MVSKVKWMRAIKPQFLVDKNGIPLSVEITKAGGSDHLFALPVVDQIKIVNGRRGRPRTRPVKLVADRGYAARGFRNELRKRSIRHQIPVTNPGGNVKCFKGRPPNYQPLLYKARWKVERTIAWLSNFRRVNVCFDRITGVYKAFCVLASLVIAVRYF